MNRKQFLEKYAHINNTEFYQLWQKEFGETNKNTMRSIKNRYLNGLVEEAHGRVEKIRSHHLTEKGYKIHYADTYIEATHEDIRKALMLYCIGKLTQEQVSIEMGWTRAEFYAVKTAFKIVKNGQPFTPHEIDNLTAEQMAEIMRIEKKRFAKAKFEANKHRDIEKEIKRHHKADYWFERLAEMINERDNRRYVVQGIKPIREIIEEVRHVIKITDIHSGLETKNVFNTYNFEVMSSRFKEIYEYTIKNVPVGPIDILETGDTSHGSIHGSTDKHSQYFITSSFKAADEFIILIDSLLELGYAPIRFAKSNGSHSSLEKNKKDRTEEENLGRYLNYTLEKTYRNDDRVEILPILLSHNMTVIPMFGYAIATNHGDEGPMSTIAKSANQVSKKLGIQILEVQCGHWHHYKAEWVEGVFIEHTEALCGTDQFAAPKGLSSPAGFRHLIYSKFGKEDSKPVILKS